MNSRTKNNKLIIGIHGVAGAGKDTAAVPFLEHGYRKVSFADAIKDALNSMMGWHHAMWENREWKETPQPLLGMSPRDMALSLGTTWGRDTVDPDIWIKLAIAKADQIPAVIPDVRFENEAQAIRDAGGVIIEVVRPDNPFPKINHKSEVRLPPELIDFSIINNGSVDDLHQKIENLFEGLDAS